MGGAERVALLLCDRLTQEGIAVALCAAAGFLDAQLPPGVPRYYVEDQGRSLLGTARNVRLTAKAMRDFRPTIAHAHGVKVPGMLLAARRLLPPGQRPPVLATFHAVAASDMAVAARILARADHVACVSRALRDRLVTAGVGPEKVSVVYNAVLAGEEMVADSPESVNALAACGDAPVICLVGRLVDQKRPELFVDMAAEVMRRNDAVRFLVVGDGPLREATEARAQARGIEGALQFTGQVNDARPLVARSALMVFTSSWEGLSIAALEALAQGVPVVATKTDGMQELLASGAGLVVDDPAAMAREVLALVDDDRRREAMGRRGRALVSSQFTPERMLAAYRALYEDLAGATLSAGALH